MTVRVAIADDHAIVRAGLRAIIHSEPDLVLVGEALGGYEAIQLVEKTAPDVLVLDISMPDIDGITVTREIMSKKNNTHILILTVHEDEVILREAIKAGASGYIIKHAAEEELITAIHSVTRGEIYVHPSLLRTLLVDDDRTLPKAKKQAEDLTPREVDILKLLIQGYTNRQIADELSISIRTVEGHRANLTDKLGFRSRVELVRYARDHDII